MNPARRTRDPQPPSDEELVARCLKAQHKASQAFDELYARHAHAVLAFLYGMHRGDEHAARDALQETFLRFHTSLSTFEGGRSLRPWLVRVARNVTLDTWKGKSRRPELQVDGEFFRNLPKTDADPDPSRAVEARETAGLLRRSIYELPAPELEVFLLKFDQGLTYEEVAEALSCSLRTAKYRIAFVRRTPVWGGSTVFAPAETTRA